MTKKIIIFLIIIILVVAGFVLVKRNQNRQVAQNNNQIQQPPVPLDWKIYGIDEARIAFEAPGDLKPEELASDIKLNFPLSEPYFKTRLIKQAYIRIANPADVCEEASEGYTSTASTTLSGTPFLKRTWSGAAAGSVYRGVDYTTAIAGKCQLIQL